MNGAGRCSTICDSAGSRPDAPGRGSAALDSLELVHQLIASAELELDERERLADEAIAGAEDRFQAFFRLLSRAARARLQLWELIRVIDPSAEGRLTDERAEGLIKAVHLLIDRVKSSAVCPNCDSCRHAARAALEQAGRLVEQRPADAPAEPVRYASFASIDDSRTPAEQLADDPEAMP